jgi:HD superfamily phosphodiesterase
MVKMITLEDLRNNKEIRSLINTSSECLNAMNYTEHGLRHSLYVSRVSSYILYKLGYDEKMQELAKIAGYIHDVGNAINRLNHGIIAATLVYPILKDLGMDYDDIGLIIAAIGNHEEEIGTIVNPLCAALVIADKSDAHRTRVRRDNYDPEDIHDRVNFAILKNLVEVDSENKIIKSKFYMNNSSSVMEYFQIYINRIIMSEKASNFLGCSFQIFINDVLINSPKAMSKQKIDKIEDMSKILSENGNGKDNNNQKI